MSSVQPGRAAFQEPRRPGPGGGPRLTSMSFTVLACDYDGTIATEGLVAPAVLDALRRLGDSGVRLVLVTGRTSGQLGPLRECACLPVFDRVVLENGAVLRDPRDGGGERLLAAPISGRLVSALRERGIGPLEVGRALVATEAAWRPKVEAVLREEALPYAVTLNRDGLMLLPFGVTKATGLAAALAELGERPERCVGVGDAENDIPLLEAVGLGVAVGLAHPSLRSVADLVLRHPNGVGVSDLAAALAAGDLRPLLTAGAGSGNDQPSAVRSAATSPTPPHAGGGAPSRS
jgi:hydroxymethylpyrimidine pyrophosphatase-like HAD family hydrolase